MRTRTNQIIALLVVASMSTLTTSQINRLKAGDIVLKKDESGYHSYIVSYKKEGTGICLTYTDASCVETASYDLVDGEWVYNSTDITHLVDNGTKLYRHELNLTDESASVDLSIIIISPISAPVDSYTSLRQLLSNYVALNYFADNNEGIQGFGVCPSVAPTTIYFNGLDSDAGYINTEYQDRIDNVYNDSVSEL